MPENILIKKSGYFQGISDSKGHFQIPPFVPPPFAILQLLEERLAEFCVKLSEFCEKSVSSRFLARQYHSPRNFYKLIPLPVFFFVSFFVIFTGIRCGVDIAQKPNKSGQILDQCWKNIFCNFYEINSSQDFFLYCKNFGVDGSGLRGVTASSLQSSVKAKTLSEFGARTCALRNCLWS